MATITASESEGEQKNCAPMIMLRSASPSAAAMALASALEENVDDTLIGAVAVAEEVEARRTSAAGAG